MDASYWLKLEHSLNANLRLNDLVLTAGVLE